MSKRTDKDHNGCCNDYVITATIKELIKPNNFPFSY
jgi:hypothetical protein